MLTYNEFKVLRFLEKQNKKMTQREIAKEVCISLGSTNNAISSLQNLKYINTENMITKEGFKILQNYRVKNAVILAAGFQDKMLPITLETPKPLIKIKGIAIIESILEKLKDLELEDIYIVVGFMSEKFMYLKEKYPNITFIYNDKDLENKNIYSVYCIRDKLSNSYIIEGDLYIKDKRIFNKYEYEDFYCGYKVDYTDNFIFNIRNNYIKGLNKGGKKSYKMIGISHYTESTSRKLEKDLEKALEIPGGKEMFFDQVHLDIFKENYSFKLKEIDKNSIIEINLVKDLKNI